MEIIYIIVSLITIVCFYFFPKTERKLNGYAWIVYVLVFFLCFNSIASELLVMLNLKADSVSLCFLMVIVICGLVFSCFPTRKYQKYEYQKTDLICTIIIVLFTFGVAIAFFKPSLNLVYETSDPSIHFKWAVEFAENSTFSMGSMNFHMVNTGIIIRIGSLFVDPFNFYKIFILSDIFYYILSALIFFFSLESANLSNQKKYVLILITFLFSIGYPLNSLIFGFGYFQTGLILINLMVSLAILYDHEILPKKVFLTGISILIMGIWNSYLLFIPVIYLSTGIFFLTKYFESDRKNFKKFSSTIIVTLLIPFIIALVYYIFLPEETNSPIQKDGYIYRELFFDFFLFIPVVIYALKTIVRKKTNFLVILFFSQLVIMLLMLIAGLNGAISPYYYFKNNYLLWNLILSLFAIGLFELWDREKNAFKSILISAFLLTALVIFQVDDRIQLQNEGFSPEVRTQSIMPVINFNLDKISKSEEKSTQEKIDLFLIAKMLFDNNQSEKLPIISFGYSDGIWYQGLVGAFPEATANNEAPILSPQETYDQWEQSDSGYLVFIDNKTNYQIVLNQLIHNHHVYFENEAGYIFKK